jgi:oligopeptidase A
MSTATAENPLLEQRGLPLFDSIEAKHVKPAISSALESLEEQFDELESTLSAKSSPEYTDVVEAMEVIEAPIEYSWGVVGHLMGVKAEVIKTTTKLSQSAAVYSALEAVAAKASALDEAQKRIVDSSLKSMRLSGVALEGEAKETFNKNRMELADLSTKFSNNVLDATKAFELVLTDASDVDGLPQSALALAASRAAEGGEVEATAEAGPWKLGLDMPSYLPAMKFIKNRGVREKLYRAFVTRAGEENEPLIRKILTLRAEQARILGFDTYAEVSLERKMATSVEAVDELSEMLLDKAMPAAKRELEELTEFAVAGGFGESELALWDVPFWSERQSEEVFGFEEEELRPYFALPNVLDGLFALCKKLFGVDIVAGAAGSDGAPVWHPDVHFFSVNDEKTGERLASFYLDPYARPENKRGGAWMGVCIGKSRTMDRLPVAYLTCNGSPPVAGKPSLMTFSEVTTLFHETGHGLQHMLTQVPHKPAAGIENVEWDAVELPSQFMENFCYDEGTIYGSGLARHYETGEALPRELFEKLCAQKTYQAGMMMVRQCYFGALDMALHHRYDPSAEQSPFDFQQEMVGTGRYTVMAPLPEDRFLCGFSHIFAGGYSAGYYSYKWAEVLSADAFAAFEEVGLENDDAVREVGRRFRDTVLSLGGGTHPSEVFRLFRGRDPSPEPLLRHSGLTPDAK